MATRIYLPSSGDPDVTPSSWIFTNQINPVTYKASPAKAGTSMITRTQATGTTSPTTRAMARYVIGPLSAQSISGTLRCVIRSRESATGANATLAVAAKIVQPDGSDRAVLLGVSASDSATATYELTTTLSSRRAYDVSENYPITLTGQSASDGDYLVIELGFRSATSVSRNIDLRLGDSGGADLTDGTGETNDYDGWVEFSQDLLIQYPQTVSGVGAIASGEAFGTPTLGRGAVSVAPSAIGSVETFGTTSVVPVVAPAAIGSGEAFGSHTFDVEVLEAQDITGAGAMASAEAFGTFALRAAVYPDGDVAVGDWKTQSGGVSNLYQTIDDAGDDGDYVKSMGASPLVVSLSGIPSRSVYTGHAVGYRFRKSGPATQDLMVRLLDGTTEIARWNHANIGVSWQTVEQPLTEAQAQQLSGNSRLEFSSGYPIDMLLEVSTTNPRYLVDQNGDVKYLTSFHTWGNVINAGTSYPPDEFDWDELLQAHVSRGLTAMKCWTFESAQAWGRYRYLQMYDRTGPGNANDGRLKFDLDSISDYHIDRLESRVVDLLAENMYAVVQLFQGWDGEDKGVQNGWVYHPYSEDNNINTVDGDVNDDDDATEIYIYTSNPVLTYQEAWITAVVTRLNQYPNVIYEVCNEPTGSTGNTAWQEWVMDTVRSLEATMDLQHLCLFTVTYPNGDNDVLDSSSADLVSYNNRSQPRDGTKVNLSDTDHIEGLLQTFSTFMYEEAFIGSGASFYMDSWDGSGFDADTRTDPDCELIRDNLGYLQDLINLIGNDLLLMTPQPSLSTTGFCLARNHATAGKYAVLQPNSGAFNLNLTTAAGTLNVRWLRCSDGSTSTTTVAGGDVRTMTPPWTGAVVLYVYH